MALVNTNLYDFIKGDQVSVVGGVIVIGPLTEGGGLLINPMTTLGDLIYGGAAGTPTRLAGNITTGKQFLSQVGDGALSAAPAWATIAGSDITGAALTKVDDTNITITLGGTPDTALLRAASLTVGWTGTLADGRIASAGTWNSKQAGSASLTSLSGLIYASTSFVKMTAAGTFALDTSVYLTANQAHTLDSHSNVTITTNTAGELLKWSGTAWINNTLAEAGIQGTITAAALTKVDDTNVTITLGGTPSSALLAAASLTVGWTGTLADGRITSAATWNAKQAGSASLTSLSGLTYVSPSFVKMTAAGTFALDTSVYLTANQAHTLDSHSNVTITTNTAGEILKWSGTAWINNTLAEAGIQGTITGAALTKVDDTNVTLALGGTPASALLAAASLTLGWTGTLSVARGGTGIGTLTGVVIGTGTTAMTSVAGTASQLLRRNAGNTAYEFFTPTYAILTGAANEMLKYSTSTSAIGSGVFSSVSGNLLLGTGGAGATRAVAADGSAADVGIYFQSKGTGNIFFTVGQGSPTAEIRLDSTYYQVTLNGGVKFYASNTQTDLYGNIFFKASPVGILVGNGASAMSTVAGTANQVLRRNAGNTAYEFFTLSNPVLRAAVNVAGGATLRGIGTSPVTLIAAPGSNKFLNIISITLSYKYGTATYNFTANPMFIVSTSSTRWQMSTGTCNATASLNSAIGRNSNADIPLASNTALTLTTTDGSNATTGDGDWDLVILYTIEDTNT